MSNTHDDFTDRLSEYLDGDLSDADHAAVDSHLAVCTACRTVLDDLRAIAGAAGRLPVTAPDRELWAGVAARIGRTPRRRFSFTAPQLVAASITLMLLSGGLVYVTRPDAGRAGTSGAVPAASDRGMVPVSLADPQYDGAVADLERTLEQGRDRLDAETVRVLEQNLAAIDQAILQCRRALEADPANAYLNNHLVSARQQKLALLRRATALTTGS
ncbi:MAG TPA: zf-HC2 domain-containing protein [Vicinamibacterales bacterium]|nr:zf-HC2 domain-containing protein [Vicinamibacterales bacterium]